MNFLLNCNDASFKPIFSIIRTVISLIKIAIPIALVLFGMLDLGKAVMAGKEDEMKKAQGTLIKRVVYAVLIFLVVTIVQLVMGVVSEADEGKTNKMEWYNCLYPTDGNTNGNNGLAG